MPRSKGVRKEAQPDCWCEACHPNDMASMRMITCRICGNKRCPHATDHRNACTHSNELGQIGSSWENVKPPKSRTPLRKSRPKSSVARVAAKGRDCMVRIPGVCNGNPETTVLAHYRLAGYCGTGMKPPDEMGAWACSACHDAIDFRVHLSYENTTIRLWHAEGVMRTQQALKGEME